MRNMKISMEQISIEYNTEEKARTIYERLYPFEQEKCTVEDNTLTYNIDNPKYLYGIFEDLFRKSNYGTIVSYEKYIGDVNDKYGDVLTCFVPYEKVFRITPINRDGTKGTLDFGFRQYSNSIKFVFVNETNEFVFLSERCHVDDYNGHHQLKFDGRMKTILIEVCSLQI